MAETTGIAWTDATVNFVIGCQPAGPGCDGCYASALALRRWGIEFKPGGERRVTKNAFVDPLKWQRMYDAGKTTMQRDGKEIPLPFWCFACSLSDFFDNEWPGGARARAWQVMRRTPSLAWIIVTKRIGNAWKMLPADWDDGRNYPNVGFVATMVNQEEVNRDMRKLLDLKSIYGAKWIGLSLEPQLGFIDLMPPGGPEYFPKIDWVISGGESTQGDHAARRYDLLWACHLIDQCEDWGIPYFQKQMGHNVVLDGKPLRRPFKGKGDNIREWAPIYRVQQMPRIYGTPPVLPVAATGAI